MLVFLVDISLSIAPPVYYISPLPDWRTKPHGWTSIELVKTVRTREKRTSNDA